LPHRDSSVLQPVASSLYRLSYPGSIENRGLRRIFGPKRDGDLRKLHNEELHNLCSLTDIIRMIKSRGMRWTGYAARMWIRGMQCRILVGKSEGKRPLGRHKRGWEDNIKMDIIAIEWGGMDWFDVAQDRDQWRALVNTVMNFRVP
jgi:hypothetical protein